VVEEPKSASAKLASFSETPTAELVPASIPAKTVASLIPISNSESEAVDWVTVVAVELVPDVPDAVVIVLRVTLVLLPPTKVRLALEAVRVTKEEIPMLIELAVPFPKVRVKVPPLHPLLPSA
jgi:hypothetical protein